METLADRFSRMNRSYFAHRINDLVARLKALHRKSVESRGPLDAFQTSFLTALAVFMSNALFVDIDLLEKTLNSPKGTYL